MCVKQTNCQCPNGDPRLCLSIAFSSWPAGINCLFAAIILGRRGSRSICQDGEKNLIDLQLNKLVQSLIRSELRREPQRPLANCCLISLLLLFGFNQRRCKKPEQTKSTTNLLVAEMQNNGTTTAAQRRWPLLHFYFLFINFYFTFFVFCF